MRALLVVVVVLGALWSGYWFVGSTAKHAVIETWLSERKADGWTVDYSDFRVVGFPNRFDSRFHNLVLHDPNSGIGWKSPLFDILALSYQPNHIIAAFSPEQTFSTPLDTFDVRSKKMFASVTFEPDTLLGVRETRLRSKDVEISSAKGWTMAADLFNLSTRKTAGVKFSHDVVFDAINVTPTGELRTLLDPKGKLPRIIDAAHLNIALGFNAPWDRIAIETGTPEVTSIKVDRLDLVWGKVALGGHGDFTVATNGEISGRFVLVVRNWRHILYMLTTTGAFDRGTASAIESVMTLVTAGSDDPTKIEVPLILRDGTMRLGPVMLGPAPAFVRN